MQAERKWLLVEDGKYARAGVTKKFKVLMQLK